MDAPYRDRRPRERNDPVATMFAMVFIATVAIVAAATLLGHSQAQGVQRPRPADEAPPADDQLYVWSVPQDGTQSVLVLRVLDGDTAECAYLVPFTIRVKGVNAPEMRGDTKAAGEKSKKFLDELIGGKLLPARLHGREKYGRTLADFWLGKEAGWASKAILKSGNATEYNP